MRFVRYIFLALVGLALVLVAVANRAVVTVHVLPGEFAQFLPMGNSYRVPQFVVILGGVVLGLLIGAVWEWFRERKQRAEATRKKRELGKLEREVQGLREKTGEGKDDVLALLD